MKEEQRVGLKESVKVLSLYDNHPADLGTASYERELDEGLMAHLKRDLQLIKEAIGRIDEGHYGICLSCDEPLSSKRLKVLPQAPLCKDCQKDREDVGVDRL